MLTNTRLSGVLASCRMIILLAAAFCASPSFSEENGLIEVTEAIPFRNLSYVDEQKKPHKLKRDLGKLTLVHFWSTWCVPCVDELPKLDKFQKDYADQGIKVITISMDGVNKINAVQDFYQKHAITHLGMYVDKDNEAFRDSKTRGLPTTYFLDANGLRIAVAEGPLDWQSKDTKAFTLLHLKANQ